MHREEIENSNDIFFENYEKKDSLLVLLYMVLSCGIYLFFWLYELNKEFTEAYFEKPEANWGIMVLIIIPFLWFMTNLIFKFLIFGGVVPLFNKYLEGVGWVVIIILILKYLYEFCQVFEIITHSNAVIWYYFMFPGFISLVLTFFNFYYTLPLVFFTIICVPSMQEQLNTSYEIYLSHKKENLYASYGRKNSY